MSYEIKEECGIFGGYSKNSPIAPIIKDGLFNLQHRGQDSAGIVTGDKNQQILKAKGLVLQALSDIEIEKMQGHFGIGHVRYATSGDSSITNAQPYLIKYMDSDCSLAHNGNVKKALKLRKKFESIGEVFITDSDSEVLLKRIVYGLKKSPSLWTFDEIANCLKKDFSKGAFSLLINLPDKVMGFRDPLGYRPLCFADTKEGYFLASEDVAFNFLNVNKIIEIKAGEGIIITKDGYEIKRYAPITKEKKCVFEQIYFASMASNIFNRNVYETRVKLGKILAEIDNTKADIVVPVMDSGLASSIGYSEVSKIPLSLGLVRNHFAKRSFIEPNEKSRTETVKNKTTTIESVVKNKKIILIDDSLVRGTTAKEIIKMLKEKGASEIHFRLASPIILNSCEWGVNISDNDNLIARKCKNEDEIAKMIGANSVKYLPFEKLKDIFKDGFCFECFRKNGGKNV